MQEHWNTFLADERGATSVEYALILLASAVALIASVPPFRQKIMAIFNGIVSGWIS